jgi:hypothetical protein
MDTKEIRKAVRKHPFQPFTLRMNDGREFYIPHPEYVAVGRDVVVIVDIEDEETTTWVEPLLIASMHAGKPRKSPKNGKKPGGNS